MLADATLLTESPPPVWLDNLVRMRPTTSSGALSKEPASVEVADAIGIARSHPSLNVAPQSSRPAAHRWSRRSQHIP